MRGVSGAARASSPRAALTFGREHGDHQKREAKSRGLPRRWDEKPDCARELQYSGGENEETRRRKISGIIFTKSSLVLVKWTLAVRKSIAAIAHAPASRHVENASTPNAPSPPKTINETRNTAKTTMILSLSSPSIMLCIY